MTTDQKFTTLDEYLEHREHTGRIGGEKLLAERGKEYYRQLGQYSSAKRQAKKDGTPFEDSFQKWIAAVNKGVEEYQRAQAQKEADGAPE